MITHYVDEFGTLRIYKGTQCLACISHCENSTTQEIQNLISEVIIESGYSQYLGDFVKYNDEIFFVTDDNSHYKVNGTETELLLLPKEYSDANKNEELVRLGNPDNIGFWVYESFVKSVDNEFANTNSKTSQSSNITTDAKNYFSKRKETKMSKVFIKAETTGYEGNGEFWVRVADDEQSQLIATDYIVAPENLPETITADEITGTLGQLLDEVDLPADLHNQVQDLYSRAADLLDGNTPAETEAKYDGSLESLFESISREIESTVQICISEYSDLVSQLFNFGYEAMDLIKPCLYNKKAFDMVNMISEVRYWVDAYKSKYSGKELVRECCQAIVFNLFCIIDGVSSNNDFKIEKTVFDDTLQDAEFHQLWCEYLNKQQLGE